MTTTALDGMGAARVKMALVAHEPVRDALAGIVRRHLDSLNHIAAFRSHFGQSRPCRSSNSSKKECPHAPPILAPHKGTREYENSVPAEPLFSRTATR